MVIVGAGVSGLAAARFYQKRMGPDAKILILDNHDDFGGHAKRNEFQYNGQMRLGIGGSVNLDGPADYNKISKGLLNDLGIELEAMRSNTKDFGFLSATDGSVLALPGPEGHVKVRGKWGQLMFGVGDYETAVRDLPLPASEQDLLIELFSGDRGYLKDLSLDEKSAYIESVTYAEFLTTRVGLSKDTILIFYPFPTLMAGPAASRISVLEAFKFGSPGMQGMGDLGDLGAKLLEGLMAGSESLYFPDGNASVARLLVHKLIPAVAPDTRGFEDIVTSRFDYGALDLERNSCVCD